MTALQRYTLIQQIMVKLEELSDQAACDCDDEGFFADSANLEGTDETLVYEISKSVIYGIEGMLDASLEEASEKSEQFA